MWNQELNTAFFRIFQEALTNIIRHANATKVEVRLAEIGGQVVLEIRDRGRGISEEEIYSKNSIGLLGIRERATLLGGSVQIEGTPGKGTTLTVRIPNPAKALLHENSHHGGPRRRAAGLEADSR